MVSTLCTWLYWIAYPHHLRRGTITAC